jgi:type III secretory pathway component EscS
MVMASFDLATNLTPIIQGVVAIMPLFLDLVISIVPVIITLSVVGFLLSFFDAIMAKIKM